MLMLFELLFVLAFFVGSYFFLVFLAALGERMSRY
jgi:hypothetical protein